MTAEQDMTLILKDQAGDYYLLPQETLERGRVPAEHRAEVERVLAEAEGDDVSGHLVFALGFLVGAAVATTAIGGTVAIMTRETGTFNSWKPPGK